MNKTMQFKDRIKNLAQKNHIPAQAVLQNFMLERLLERISVSKYHGAFILKGGMLIASMVGVEHRTTMDMDMTMRGYQLSEKTVQRMFVEICAIRLDDKAAFSLVRIIPIREEDEYGGYRVAVLGRYESINTPLKIDITTGDIITPRAVRYEYHSVFSNKRIKIWAYNIETLLAEKVETILRRSILNTRPRDFYDIYLILKTKHQELKTRRFRTALLATSERRGSMQAIQEQEKILETIRADPSMQQRWNRYQRANEYARGIEFDKAIEVIASILETSEHE